MTPDNSLLVRHGMTTLERDVGPYPGGARWAEPDLEHAAELMRQVFDDRDAARALGEKARSTVQEHSAERTGAAVAARLAEIRELRAGGSLDGRRRGHVARRVGHALTRVRTRLEAGLASDHSRYGAAGDLARKALLRTVRPLETRLGRQEGAPPTEHDGLANGPVVNER
jgi:hypothetical protein